MPGGGLLRRLIHGTHSCCHQTVHRTFSVAWRPERSEVVRVDPSPALSTPEQRRNANKAENPDEIACREGVLVARNEEIGAFRGSSGACQEGACFATPSVEPTLVAASKSGAIRACERVSFSEAAAPHPSSRRQLRGRYGAFSPEGRSVLAFCSVARPKDAESKLIEFGSRTPGIGRGRVHAQFRTSRNVLWTFRASSGLSEHGPFPCLFRGPSGTPTTRRGEAVAAEAPSHDPKLQRPLLRVSDMARQFQRGFPHFLQNYYAAHQPISVNGAVGLHPIP